MRFPRLTRLTARPDGVRTLKEVDAPRRNVLLDQAKAVFESRDAAGFERRRQDLLDAIARAI